MSISTLRCSAREMRQDNAVVSTTRSNSSLSILDTMADTVSDIRVIR